MDNASEEPTARIASSATAADDEHDAGARGDVGYVHSHDNASAVDGPGLRYVVWLMGCHLRCQYCHNPDALRLPPAGNRMTVEEVLADVARYGDFLRAGGGGFTVSGGEPLVQAPFAMRLLRGAKSLGLHAALDTNGYLGDSLADDDLADVDLVLLDLKAFDAEQHARVTGVDNAKIFAFARRLAAIDQPAWVRYVLVPDLTDGREDMSRLAEFVAGLPNVQRLEVLPFHQLGRGKWLELGMTYRLESTRSATAEQAEAARELFRSAGCPVG